MVSKPPCLTVGASRERTAGARIVSKPLGSSAEACALGLLDKERPSVSNLSAADNYKADHLKQPGDMSLWKKVKDVYSAGFVMTVCPGEPRQQFSIC